MGTSQNPHDLPALLIAREHLYRFLSLASSDPRSQRWAKLGEHPLVGETRMVGLMGAIELVADKSSLEKFDEDKGAGTICRDFLVNNGLVMRTVGDTIVTAPPLIITHEQVDELVEIAWKCLDLTQAAL